MDLVAFAIAIVTALVIFLTIILQLYHDRSFPQLSAIRLIKNITNAIFSQLSAI